MTASERFCVVTSPVYWTCGMLLHCAHCMTISVLISIASNTWWASTRRPSRAQSRNLVRRRHLPSSRASLMAMARLLAAAERPLPGSRRCASTPPHLDYAASPACWWQDPCQCCTAPRVLSWWLASAARAGTCGRLLLRFGREPLHRGRAARYLSRQRLTWWLGSLPRRGLVSSMSSPSCRCGVEAHR